MDPAARGFLNALGDIFTWRAPAAGFLAAIGVAIETLVGDPYGANGRGVLLVVALLAADFILGTWAALATVKWTFAGLRRGVGKLMLSGILLIVAKQLVLYPLGSPIVDIMLGYCSDFLLAYLVLSDLLSAIGHIVVLQQHHGINPGPLLHLSALLTRWQERGIIPAPQLPAMTSVTAPISPSPASTVVDGQRKES